MRRKWFFKTREVIAYILISMFTMTIGYATITSDIDVKNLTLVEKDKWDIHFDNVYELEKTTTVMEDAKVSKDKTQVLYSVDLRIPGDTYSFTVDVVNAGTIDATLENINLGQLSEEQQRYLEYTVTYVNGEALNKNDILKKDSKETLKITVRFKKDITKEDLPTKQEELKLALDLDYVDSRVYNQ